MKHLTAILVALAAFAGVNVYAQKFSGLALKPPMGWNSWNKFAGNINEDLIRQTADAMATNGMRDAGYVYCLNTPPDARRPKLCVDQRCELIAKNLRRK
jgi:alpha-galactosidase